MSFDDEYEKSFGEEKTSYGSDDIDQFALQVFEEANENISSNFEMFSLLKSYLALFGGEDDESYSLLVPREFDVFPNNEVKCSILREAIDKRIKITETSLFPNLIEGVVLDGTREVPHIK